MTTVLLVVATAAVLLGYVEARVRLHGRPTCGCRPVYRTVRNGRVRFRVEDLRAARCSGPERG